MADLAAEIRRLLPRARYDMRGARVVVRVCGAAITLDETIVALTPAWVLASEVEWCARAMRASRRDGRSRGGRWPRRARTRMAVE